MKYDLFIDGRIIASESEKRACIVESMTNTLAALLDAGVRQVWILKEVPSQRFNAPKQLALHALFGWQDIRAIPAPDFRQRVTILDQIFDQVSTSRVSFFDLAAALKNASGDGLLIGGDCAYCDNSHLSATAARAIALHIGQIFTSCGCSGTPEDSASPQLAP